MMATVHAVDHSARVGPNAIVQVAAALRKSAGERLTRDIFHTAHLEAFLIEEPKTMVGEEDVAALHRAVRTSLTPEQARRVLHDAGARTGDYLLGHRIPRAAQRLLKLSPPWLASRLLLAAISRHAWTFAGSGGFRACAGQPVLIAIEGCPICRGEAADEPVCGYYAAVFARLFEELVSPKAQAREIECQAMGAAACRFAVAW